jgi:hypothetical protein
LIVCSQLQYAHAVTFLVGKRLTLLPPHACSWTLMMQPLTSSLHRAAHEPRVWPTYLLSCTVPLSC